MRLHAAGLVALMLLMSGLAGCLDSSADFSFELELKPSHGNVTYTVIVPSLRNEKGVHDKDVKNIINAFKAEGGGSYKDEPNPHGWGFNITATGSFRIFFDGKVDTSIYFGMNSSWNGSHVYLENTTINNFALSIKGNLDYSTSGILGCHFYEESVSGIIKPGWGTIQRNIDEEMC